jgi:hypothetical protein
VEPTPTHQDPAPEQIPPRTNARAPRPGGQAAAFRRSLDAQSTAHDATIVMQAITDKPAKRPNPSGPQLTEPAEPAQPQGPPPGKHSRRGGRSRPGRLSVIVAIAAVLAAAGGLALVLANSGPSTDPTAPSALPAGSARQTVVIGGAGSGAARSRTGNPTPRNSKGAIGKVVGQTSTPTPAPAQSSAGTPIPTPGAPTATAVPSASATSTTTYLAVSSSNTLAGGAVLQSCSACTGGQKVGYIGNGSGTLTFNSVNAGAAGVYPVQIVYCNGTSGDTGRSATFTVNGVVAQTDEFPSTGSFSTPGAVTEYLPLRAGSNTVEISNGSAYAPDINSIIVTL